MRDHLFKDTTVSGIFCESEIPGPDAAAFDGYHSCKKSLRMKARKKLSFALSVLVLVFFACHKKEDFTGLKPAESPCLRPFEDASPFYDTIPAHAAIDPRSQQMVQGLVQSAQQGFVLALKEWTVPVFIASPEAPRYDVRLTASWAPKRRLRDVPIPLWAQPDPESDGHLVVVDTAGGCVYDFWRMRRTARGWKAAWGNALPLDSDGIFPKGLSARGSGFELMQGIVWPCELEAGAIEHALIFSYDFTRAGGPVAPATESDGATASHDAIPEGARLQLDPALDLDALDLSPAAKIIARALQRYGMYCADTGGGLQLYGLHAHSSRTNPWAPWFGEQALVDLSKIPADRFRVLALPPQRDDEPELVPNDCAIFE